LNIYIYYAAMTHGVTVDGRPLIHWDCPHSSSS